ncbi:MAG: substrate-binding domain-containing protein [Elusimicrobia bacterium]|nr:substrate-binding domain-containing protein [Elusimicrobiota bacterium]
MKARIALVVLSCVLSLATGWVLSRGGTAESKSPGRKVLIGFSMDTLKEERWQHDRDYLVAKARELGADVLVQAANSDDTRQIADVQALLSRKVDVLIIAPHNGAAMAKAVDMAHEAGVPVISYDRLITGSDPDLYISHDAVKVGAEQARFITAKVKPGRPMRIIRIFGAKTDNNAHLLKRGQDEVLAPCLEKGSVRIVHEDWAENWKPENAKKIVNAAITRFGGGFDAVIAANDGTAGGAIQALTEEGLAGKVIVTGQDAELSACQRVARGAQAMTIYKSISALAGRTAQTAVAMATGRPVIAGASVDNGKIQVPAVLLDVVTVTKDNIEETVVKDGFHKREEVFGR